VPPPLVYSGVAAGASFVRDGNRCAAGLVLRLAIETGIPQMPSCLSQAQSSSFGLFAF